MISNIKFLKHKYENSKNDIIRLTSHTEYEQTIKHYDAIIEKLSTELIALPIGYRYIGIFYIKNSYTVPAKFERHDGVVYLREDLVSWQIEKGLNRPDYGYHRNIFKNPTDGAELKREDAEPVYEPNHNKIVSTV